MGRVEAVGLEEREERWINDNWVVVRVLMRLAWKLAMREYYKGEGKKTSQSAISQTT